MADQILTNAVVLTPRPAPDATTIVVRDGAIAAVGNASVAAAAV
jgi:predicted amidohydrolase YtcJ